TPRVASLPPPSRPCRPASDDEPPQGEDDGATDAMTTHHNQLGEFLRTSRAAVSPGEVGLPLAGRRMTGGLRREEVATLSNVSLSWYTALEQGRRVGVSEQVLGAIVGALRLDPVGAR